MRPKQERNRRTHVTGTHVYISRLRVYNLYRQ